MLRKLLVLATVGLLFSAQSAYTEDNAAAPQGVPAPAKVAAAPAAGKLAPAAAAPVPANAPVPAAAPGAPVMAKIEPYRTFITIQRYNMESNGEPASPISNVRLTITFPNGNKVSLPEGNQWWPIGNGQAQEINRTFELPFSYIASDGFKFTIQMERKGSTMLPCNFDVVQLSQFNRTYNCHTDVAWQQNKKYPNEKLDKEGIQIRVFTNKNSEPKEIPTDAIALK